MKTTTRGNLEATIYGNKVSVCDNAKGIEVIYDYPFHQTEQSAMEYCLNKYESINGQQIGSKTNMNRECTCQGCGNIQDMNIDGGKCPDCGTINEELTV